MAITRGSNEATDLADFNDSAHTLTYSGASGRLHIACAFLLSDAVTFTTPTASNVTFTSAGVANANGTRVQVWYGVSTGAVGNITFGTSGNTSASSRVWCVEYLSSSGWTSPFDVADTDTEGSAITTHPSTSSELQITTTGGANIVVIGLIGLDRSATSLSTPSGYTLYATVDGGVDLLAYRIDTATATRNFDSTSGAAAISASVLAAFKEDSGGGGGGELTWVPQQQVAAGRAGRMVASGMTPPGRVA